MKQTFFRLVDHNKEFKDLVDQYLGKSAVLEDDGFYYASIRLFNERKIEEIRLFPTSMIFNEELKEIFEEIYAASIQDAESVSDEPVERGHKDLFSPIKSLLIKLAYEPPESTLHFAADLFIEVAMGHMLINGNKRAAFTFLINSLYYFGFHFFGAKPEASYLSYSDKIVKFVEDMENRSDAKTLDKRSATRQAIVTWIRQNVMVAMVYENSSKTLSEVIAIDKKTEKQIGNYPPKDLRKFLKECWEQPNTKEAMKQIISALAKT